MFKLITIIVISLGCLACNTVGKMVYGTNKQRTFNSIDEYKAVLSDYSIPFDNVFYLDSASYDSYMYDLVVGQKLDYLVGIFVNDST